MLGELKAMLLKSTVWFGCFIIIESNQEELILNIARFNLKGLVLYSTEIIRIFIDRANLTLAIFPIL
jgi:hypothetical protein